MLLCDLHNHSVFSDGTFTPTQLVENALRLGLGAVALTDHNTIAGLPEFLNAARGTALEAVPGVEISTEHEGREFHLLALFVSEESYAPLGGLLAEPVRRSDQSKRQLVERLRNAGLDLDYDEIRRKAGDISINRAHIAFEMIDKGYVRDKDEAFSRYLNEGLGYYIEPKRLDLMDTISFVRDIGALSVLAHPLLRFSAERLEPILAMAAQRGLDAMEVRYSEYDADTTRTAGELAGKYGLLSSGGSDFHGGRKPGLFMGSGRGSLEVPYEWYLALRERHEGRR